MASKVQLPSAHREQSSARQLARPQSAGSVALRSNRRSSSVTAGAGDLQLPGRVCKVSLPEAGGQAPPRRSQADRGNAFKASGRLGDLTRRVNTRTSTVEASGHDVHRSSRRRATLGASADEELRRLSEGAAASEGLFGAASSLCEPAEQQPSGVQTSSTGTPRSPCASSLKSVLSACSRRSSHADATQDELLRSSSESGSRLIGGLKSRDDPHRSRRRSATIGGRGLIDGDALRMTAAQFTWQQSGECSTSSAASVSSLHRPGTRRNTMPAQLCQTAELPHAPVYPLAGMGDSTPMKDILRVQRETKIPTEVLRAAMKLFRDNADTSESYGEESHLSKVGFGRVLSEMATEWILDGHHPTMMVERDFRTADTSGRGKLSFKDFAVWFSSRSFHEAFAVDPEESRWRDFSRSVGVPLPELESHKLKFDSCDQDGSGMLDREGFHKLLLQCLKLPEDIGMPSGRLQQFWSQATTGELIDFKGFITFYKNCTDPYLASTRRI